MNSEPHRAALLKVLNQAYVADDISTKKLDRLVGNIAANNFISFSDDEIPTDGRGSTKALHITLNCKGHILSKVLVDNGSALNVMPLSTLTRLPIDIFHMKRSHTIVRAFDGTRREVVGNIEIPLQIGPCTYNVDFQMDIKPSYSCLIRRPWIHSARAIPSFLHQKLKFVIDEKLVSIAGEEELIAMTSTEAPYVGPNEEALDCLFRSLEFVNTAFVKEGSKILVPQLSMSSFLRVNEILGRGAQIGKGLGKHLHGKVKTVPITMKMDRYGLRYQPSKKDCWKHIEQRKGRRLA